jgi:hypothetical protein
MLICCVLPTSKKRRDQIFWQTVDNKLIFSVDSSSLIVQPFVALPLDKSINPNMTNHYGNPLVTSPRLVNRSQTLPLHRHVRMASFEQAQSTIDSPPFLPSFEQPNDNHKHHHIASSYSQFISNSSMSTSANSWSSSSSDIDSSNRSSLGNSSLVGLPSAYPLHRKNSSIDSTFIFDDMDGTMDFDLRAMSCASKTVIKRSMHPLYKSNSSTSNTLTIAPSSSLTSLDEDDSDSTRTLTRSKKPTHRRRQNRRIIGSAAQFHEMVVISKESRRNRNRALSAEDFEDGILEDLFMYDLP